MSFEYSEDWVNNLVYSHKKKLEEIKQWEPNNMVEMKNDGIIYSQNKMNQLTQIDTSLSQVPPHLMCTKITVLEHKLQGKKAKIKTLKENINMLIFENQKLNEQINELERANQQMQIASRKELYIQNNSNDDVKELLNKIDLLNSEVRQKSELLMKIGKNEDVKMKEIEMLNQKNKDLELISEENEKENLRKIEELQKSNDYYKGRFLEFDKMFEIINYFIKRISKVFPKIAKQSFTPQNPKLFQNVLLDIENGIMELVEMKKEQEIYMTPNNSFLYKQRGKSNLNSISNLEEKIKVVTEQNLHLEKMIKDKKRKKSKKKHS